MAKSPFSHENLGPWPRGMVIKDRRTEVPLDGLWDALNVDVRDDGTVATRPEWTQAMAASDCHSLFTLGGRVWGVVDGDLSELDDTGATALMAVDGPISWTSLNDEPVFATRQEVYRIRDQAVELLSDGSRDEQDMDDVLVPLPGGQWVDYWNGRLIVARGSSLLFSEPLRYGAHNPMTGYLRFGQRVEWVAPLESGIFVGLPDRVLFLEGSTPEQLAQRQVAGRSAPGMATVVHNELLGGSGPYRVALFFTQKGFAVGAPDGSVAYPQAETMSGLPLHRGKLVVDGSRIYAVRGF